MKKIGMMAFTLLLTACACPDVVETRKFGDETMSCQQLVTEIREIETAREEISREKGVTGTNVAAAVFFWPALIATHSNVNDAMRALNHRKSHLMEIYNRRSCHLNQPGQPVINLPGQVIP
jgi:hypothetical protein